MERVAVTLDDDLAGSLSRYARRHRLNRDVAAERLLAAALAEWRRDRAVDRFAAGELSFARAADAAGIDRWRFAELLREAARPARPDAADAADSTGPTISSARPPERPDSCLRDGSRLDADRLVLDRVALDRDAIDAER